MSDKPKRRQSGFRYEVIVNGKRSCMAGSGKYGVLSIGLNWVRHDPGKRPKTKTPERWNCEECDLRVGAITRGQTEAWKKVSLNEGDEIVIRLLGPGSAEAPRVKFRQPTPKPERRK